MATVRKSASQLTITSFSHTPRLVVGLTLLLVGLLIIFAIFMRLIHIRSLVSESWTELPQSIEMTDDLTEDDLTPGEVFVLILYGGARSLTREQRPVVALAILTAIVAAAILAGCKRSQIATFDRSKQQVTIIQPDRFFRAKVLQYPFEAIAAIRIDRDRSFLSRAERSYRVQLEIDLQDAAAKEQSDFIYKKVYPLSSYNHDQAWAEDTFAELEAFVQRGREDM